MRTKAHWPQTLSQKKSLAQIGADKMKHLLFIGLKETATLLAICGVIILFILVLKNLGIDKDVVRLIVGYTVGIGFVATITFRQDDIEKEQRTQKRSV